MSDATIVRATSQEMENLTADLLDDLFSGRILPPVVDPVAVSRRVTEAMLNADTPEEAMAAGATVGFDELAGVPVEVRDLVFLQSTLQGDIKVFAVIDAWRSDEAVDCTIVTSAQQVMRTLVVWKAKGWLPATFKVSKSDNRTAAGYVPYVIEAV